MAYVEYTIVSTGSGDKLNTVKIQNSVYLPKIRKKGAGVATLPDESDIEVTLNDGTVTTGSNISVSDVKSVKITYPDTATSIRFMGTSTYPHGLKSIIHIDTASFTTFEYMFSGCGKLTDLDVSTWKITNVTGASCMFANCISLKVLDLSSWNTSRITSSMSMFDGWTSSQVVYIGNNWTIDTSSYSATFINLATVNKIAVYTFDNTISADCPITLRSSESNSFNDFQTVDTVNDNITHRTIYVSNDVVITSMRIYYQSSLLTVEYMQIDENITSCYGLVANAKKLTYINMDNWDTKNTKDMGSMFVGCELLTDLDLSHLDTSQVEDMRMMFWGCTALQNLNVAGWNTSKVTDMYGMFGMCKMTILDISSFDTSSVTDYGSMFSSFASTQKVYVGKKWTLGTSGFGPTIIVTQNFAYTLVKYTFNSSTDCLPNITGATSSQWGYSDRVDGNITTRIIGTDEPNLKITNYNFNDKTSLLTIDYIRIDSNVTSLYRLGRNCTKLKSINTSGWDVSNITTCDSMFSGASAITSIDLSNYNFTKLTDMDNMFNNCTNLTEVNLTNFKAQPTTMSYTFRGCSKLTVLDVAGIDTSKCTNMSNLFRGCKNINSIDLISWDTGKVTTISDMFYGWTQSQIVYTGKRWTIDTSAFSATFVSIIEYAYTLARYTFNRDAGDCVPIIEGIDSRDWGYTDTIDDSITTRVIGTDIENAPVNGYTFQNQTSLLGIEYLQFNKMINTMANMFDGCTNLKNINTTDWDTTSVTDMKYAFNNCSSLTSLDTSQFNTDLVTDMSYMFSGCSKLTSINVSTFKTNLVTNMESMFGGCEKLENLDILHFNTSNCSNLSLMFANCLRLTTLDLSSWSTNNVNIISKIFLNCSGLTLLDISNFNIGENVNVNQAFNGCDKLEDVSLIYSSTTTVNKLSALFDNVINRNVYYMDADGNNLTSYNHIEYIPYQKTITLNEDIILRSKGDVYDELDLLTGKLIQRIGEDNEILEEEIVRNVTITGDFSIYAKGVVDVNSTDIIPELEYKFCTKNYYVIPQLKPKTEYTIFFKGEPTKVYVGGNVVNNPITKTIVLSGEVDNILSFDTSVTEVMLIEGDLTNRNVEYFTGVKSSQKLEIQIRSGGAPIFGEGGRK